MAHEKHFIADKETLDKVKADTSAILADIAEVQNSLQDIRNVLSDDRIKRYGWRRKIGEPNMEVEYIYDAIGLAPAFMDYDRGVFQKGDWGDKWIILDNYACMVKFDGTEDYRLDPDNYDLKENGDASDISNIGYDGNGMAAIPLTWVKRFQADGWQYFIASEEQYDDTYRADAHVKADGTIGKVAYHALFEGFIDSSGKLRSIAGQRPESSTTADAEREAAKKNGDKWDIRTWSLNELIADLGVLISKTFDGQTAFGKGHSDGQGTKAEDLLACGTLKDKGQFYGYNTTDKAVKVFHIENFWGNRWERLVGLILDNGKYKVKMTPENDGYNLTGDGYIDTNITITAASADFQRDTIQNEYGRFPIPPFTGSDSTYEGDGIWVNVADVRVAYVGGGCSSPDVSRCGPRCLIVDNLASRAYWNIGASLSCEGPSSEGGLGYLSPNESSQEAEGQPEAADPITARTKDTSKTAVPAAKK